MIDQALTAIAEFTEEVSDPREVGFLGCTSGSGLALDPKGLKRGSTEALFALLQRLQPRCCRCPVAPGCNYPSRSTI